MKHLISKVKYLFKHKEKQVFIWLLDKDFFKNANIQFKEIDYSHIHAENINASKIKEVWK